ncbi:MAG: hypothetical protein ACE5GM_03090 [bacterium]
MLGSRIKLPKELVEKAEQFAEKAGYASVDEFVCHLIEKEVSQIDEEDSEEEVKQKLQGLGYLS